MCVRCYIAECIYSYLYTNICILPATIYEKHIVLVVKYNIPPVFLQYVFIVMFGVEHIYAVRICPKFTHLCLEYGLPWWLRWQRTRLPCGRSGFDPWVGKIPWRRAWQPNPIFFPGQSPWTEEPGRLQSMGSQRVRHN